MYKTESIDFTQENLVSGSFLKLKQQPGCNYRSDLAGWEIKDPQGFFEFTINADDVGITGFIEFVLNFQGETNRLVTVSVNDYKEGNRGMSHLNVSAAGEYYSPEYFYYIPLGKIKAGENTIRVQAEGGSTPFVLAKATLSGLMHGVESIDFSVEAPKSGSCLKFKEASGFSPPDAVASAWDTWSNTAYATWHDNWYPNFGSLKFTFLYGEQNRARSVGFVLNVAATSWNNTTSSSTAKINIYVNSNLLQTYQPNSMDWKKIVLGTSKNWRRVSQAETAEVT
jgi:hypothetical protein